MKLIPDAVQVMKITIISFYPQKSIIVFPYGIDPVMGKYMVITGLSLVYFKIVTVVTVQAIECSEPQKSVPVAVHAQHLILRESVPGIEMFKPFNFKATRTGCG
jgi:hypothetical protein